MKKLQFLKALLHFIWFFSVIGIIGMIVFIPFLFFSNDPFDIPIKINGETLLVVDLTTKILLTFICVAYCFFVYGIYQLKKVLDLFSKRIIFDDSIILLLHQIGLNFILASLFTGLPLFFYKIIHKGSIGIEFGGGFSSFLFTSSLGLFFMVLSEVFKIAKTMKEENELTV